MKILLIGLSHKTAPVEVREKLSFTPAMLRSSLTHFDSMHSQAHLDDVYEGVILSTCNRLELYAVVGRKSSPRQTIINFLGQACELAPARFVDYLYTLEDEDAIRHLMRVAAGLDSLVLGEPQILGQITDAYEAALSQGAVGTVLSSLFQAAIHTGKRTRTETAIGVNPASISSVAADAAMRQLGNLANRQVLLIGAGEMATIAARALRKRGATNIVVANRTFSNATELADELGGKAITFQQLPAALVHTDIIITSTGAPHTIVNRKMLEPVMTCREDRPIFIIDIAVPRDVDPDVTELPNVYLRDIDSLQSQADDNIRERKAEIPRVEKIVEEEVVQFMNWYLALGVVPTIKAMRRHLEYVRQTELEHLFKRLDVDDRTRKLVEKMSHRLINKILHEPTVRLKREAANGGGVTYTSAMRYLFGLDGDKLTR